ncbi:MAG: class I SAM-dependent methyltransferase [Candidatus Marinimicrobia bacterium]|nr:class I SAM-dependent methyltransferase [Candidatus Neomarinimicrobiota bacterium]
MPDKKIPIICEPYSESAQVYDAMMADVDYISWADYIADIIEQEKLQVDKIADISCGTGLLMKALENDYPNLFGFDNSEDMLNIARSNYPDISVMNADMNKLPKDLHFDLFVNIHDALNYFQSPDDITEHLQLMTEHLKEGAAYFFDFALPLLIENYFANTVEEGEGPGECHFRRENTWNIDSSTCETKILISKPDDREKIYLEKHVQKIYTLDEIREMCSKVKNASFRFYKEFTFEEADDSCERLFMVMRYDPLC